MLAAASASAVVLRNSPAAAAELGALNGGVTGQSDLQAFLAKSFGWQPG
jgi:hypothetical protein